MKTYNEIKAEYFTEIGYPNWNTAILEMSIGCSKMQSALKLERHLGEIAKRYAQEVAQHALNNAADNARIKADGGLYMSPYKFISVKGKQTYEHKVFIEKSTITDDKNIDL